MILNLRLRPRRRRRRLKRRRRKQPLRPLLLLQSLVEQHGQPLETVPELPEVELRGEYQGQYDHAGLMSRVDRATWLKCGIEYVAGVQLASAVVTRGWSDWSVMPIGSQPATWWRLTRHGQTFQGAFSVDGKKFETVRQAFLTENSRVEVGGMACAPKGDGFSVTFSNLTVEGIS